MTLLQMSFSGALMILVIAVLRFLLQRKVHRNVWILLWILVVLRLILPFSFPAATSIYNLQLMPEASPQMQAETAGEPAAPQAALSEAHAQQANQQINIPQLIWLSGTAAVLLIVIGTHLKNLRRYRTSLPCEASLPPMPKGVHVRTLDTLDAPLTYGIFKPTILLPASFPMSDTRRLNHVLQHELSHIRNRDILTKLVLIIAAAIHWFNPFVWLMMFLASQDMEMRCDAQAVSALENDRLGYAYSLVAAEEDRLSGLLQAGFSHSVTEKRIRALSKDHVAPVLSVVVCTAMMLLLGAVFMTGQVEASQNEALPPAPVSELQETTPEMTHETQEADIVIPADDPEELPEPEPEEVAEEEELPEEPAAEEDSTETQTEEPIIEEEASTESEQVTQAQSTYTPPAPDPEPQTVHPSQIVHPTVEEVNVYGDNSINLSPPPNYNAGQPEFPVVVLPDPTPKINYPVPGANVPGHYPSLPGY